MKYDQQGNISSQREDELNIRAAVIESGTSGVSDVPELSDAGMSNAGKSDAGKIAEHHTVITILDATFSD